jgi:hypothetical protein
VDWLRSRTEHGRLLTAKSKSDDTKGAGYMDRDEQQVLETREVKAMRDRIAELEGDLSVAQLQLAAHVCSGCPAKARVANLDAALRRIASGTDAAASIAAEALESR